jgi:hypothetical protein
VRRENVRSRPFSDIGISPNRTVRIPSCRHSNARFAAEPNMLGTAALGRQERAAAATRYVTTTLQPEGLCYAGAAVSPSPLLGSVSMLGRGVQHVQCLTRNTRLL